MRRRKDEWRTILCAPALAITAVGCAIGAEDLVARGVSPWLVRPLALLAIALCQNGLQMLHHEGAHGHFFRRPRLNELWTDFWCGVPFFDFVRSYRYFHFTHHRHVGDPEKDPELEFYAGQGYHYQPLKGFRLVRTLLLDLSGYHYLQFTYAYARYLLSGEARKFLGPREALTLAAFWSSLALVGGKIAIAYWLFSQATIVFLILKLRGYAEHAGKPGSLNENTFSYPDLPVVIKVAVWPFRSYLHREHHLRPDLPWYRLQPVPAPAREHAPFYRAFSGSRSRARRR